MRSACILAVAITLVLVLDRAGHADQRLTDLIVGKWKVRQNDSKEVEFFEFANEGKGQLSKVTEKESVIAGISWTIMATYGNACIVRITYDNAPAGVNPLVLLFAFDGPDIIVFEPTANKIVYMDRLKPIAPSP